MIFRFVLGLVALFLYIFNGHAASAVLLGLILVADELEDIADRIQERTDRGK